MLIQNSARPCHDNIIDQYCYLFIDVTVTATFILSFIFKLTFKILYEDLNRQVYGQTDLILPKRERNAAWTNPKTQLTSE